ncbi:BTAD domain-containing putative transcriptional regulator [uncultured Desulfobacter sp.]|uniref:BTAD domain-containing putative transcriptional regulator n=1 Tax=uncultured Desulfobacter sp. TaxID=240139 RepID=UPI002AA95952|nr:BTAD domain-containing putative transcriptional regulator [uncultured Desulfobacter sp.]
MDFLESKLITPHLGNLLERQRLIRTLKNLEGKRLILVTAGAGYGKTTMVAQALSDMSAGNRVLVWYRLDRFDQDITTFTSYLIRGLEKIYPGIGDALCENGFEKGGTGENEARLLELIKILESKTDKELFIVLDDYHLLGAAGKNDVTDFLSIHSYMEFFLKRLPGHVRLVLISRTDPPLKLSNLRVRRQILEIHEFDLVFSLDETAALFSRIHHQVPGTKTLSTLHSQTGGWAAGLILFGAALEKQGIPLPCPGGTDTGMSKDHMFDFLEENLFETQTPDMQQFMARTALMDHMDTTVCDSIFGRKDSQSRFDLMMAAHLMVFPIDKSKTVFHYHHLFREFLLKKLNQTHTESEIKQFHLKIAGLMEARENAMALIHYIEAHAYDDAVRFMTTFELEFLAQGKIRFIKTCLEKIPNKIIAANPRLLFMEAKQYSYFGQTDKSIACLNSACRILRNANSDAYVAKCLVDLGAQYYYTGHIPEARGLMVQVLDEAKADPATYILAVMYLSFFCTVLGDLHDAQKYESQARAVIENFPEFEQFTAIAAMDISRTYILYIQGDFEESKDVNLDLISRCTSAGLQAFLPLAYYHASATDCLLGKYETGVAFSEKGIRAAEKIHLRDSQNGWLFLSRSENHLGLGQLDAARTHAENAFKIFRRPGNRWGMANALDLMAKISLASDNISDARSQATRALNVIKGYGLPVTEAIISITHARIFMACNAFEDAGACLARARKHLKSTPWYLCSAWLLDAGCCHALGQNEAAWRHFQKGLAIARKKQFDRVVLKETGKLIQVMAEFKPESIFSSYLKALGAYQPPVRQGLQIRMLGQFQVSVDGRKIEHDQWPGSKALILFQYMAVHHSRGFIPKDVLLEMLWPDQDPNKTGKRFNTAMSRLRKLLEPDLPPRAPSAYIQRKNDHYRLSLGPGGSLDIKKFRTMAEKALKMEKGMSRDAFAVAREAERLYTGPFLKDESYQDWCIRLQDETKNLYCRLCRMLTDLCKKAKEMEPGIMYAQKFLKTDPFDESMYRELICFFLADGQYGLAQKTFTECRKRMQEMDCSLSPQTLDLMKNIPQI